MITEILVTTEVEVDITADLTVDMGMFIEPVTTRMRTSLFQEIIHRIMDIGTGTRTGIGTLMMIGMVTGMAGPAMDGTEEWGREDAGGNEYSGSHSAP